MSLFKLFDKDVCKYIQCYDEGTSSRIDVMVAGKYGLGEMSLDKSLGVTASGAIRLWNEVLQPALV